MQRLKTWLDIDASALRHNLKAISTLVKPAQVMAVVKANAYGHGLLEVAAAVKRQADWFGVDNVDEALALRHAGIRQPILILGYTRHDRIAEAVRQRISFVAYDLTTLKAAARAGSSKRPARVHLKLETGLTRQGVNEKDLRSLLVFLKNHRNIVVEGASMHFANVEDTDNDAYATLQLRRYAALLDVLRARGCDPPWTHAAASAAAILYPESRCSIIRLGVSLYGLWSSECTKLSADKQNVHLNLKPALTWKTLVAQVKRVPKGTPVSYGLTEHTKRDSKIAVLPIGYWDGYDRGLSSRGEVLIRGKRCKILGRVCMNMCMADVTDARGVQAEDEVVLIGEQGREVITAEEVAEKAGTIHYEIVTRINPLLPRILL